MSCSVNNELTLLQESVITVFHVIIIRYFTTMEHFYLVTLQYMYDKRCQRMTNMEDNGPL